MRIKIQGSQPLRGRYHVSGNSNAAIALIAATMLTESPYTLQNVPVTLSTQTFLRVAGQLGAIAATPEPNQLHIRTPQLLARKLTTEQSGAIAGSVLLLAPLLARRGHARLELDVPLSRYHTHLAALRDLGCAVKVGEGGVDLDLHRWATQEIILEQASVTATGLVCMLAAVCGEETIIHNAACEPHITDLLQFLRGAGVQVDGGGSNLLRIRGVESLKSATMTVSPDHIEAASIAALTALTDGRVIIEGVRPLDLRMILKVYERLGLRSDIDQDTLNVTAPRTPIINVRDEEVDLAIDTAPWPGFPSDLAATATVIATQAQGTVLIHEKMYSNRLLFVDRLNAMGAQIVLCDPHRAIVIGTTRLQGDYLDTPDVRTGIALLGAALCADGVSTIDNAELFDRSFEDVLGKLTALGAEIKQIG
jgi:UDP-N-acetylglucosamine 1-carboxyvinyltransferase